MGFLERSETTQLRIHVMSFTLRNIFGLLFFVALALILSQNVQAAWAMFIIAITGGVLACFVPGNKKRFLIYGGLLGSFLAIVGTEIVIAQKFEHLPREPVYRGAQFPGQTRAPQEETDTFETAAPYAVTLGFIVGGTCGLLLSGAPKNNAESPEQAPPSL